jgi:hypothetical protein
MKRYFYWMMMSSFFAPVMLHASEPKTGTLIQFGALGLIVFYTSAQVIKDLLKRK